MAYHVTSDDDSFETFMITAAELEVHHQDDEIFSDIEEPGWFYWWTLPGCMPNSEPIGPFATEAKACADAEEQVQSS